jgi:DMSO/TMAO reductase YedYZ heme-binding membrane subunit
MSDHLALLRRRFWFEATLASASGLLFVVTLFWHDWLEGFGFDPDHGDGSAEWLIVAILGVVCVASTLVARIEWRRAAMDAA